MKWLPISSVLALALIGAPAWGQRASAAGHVSFGSGGKGQGFNSGMSAGCRNGSCIDRRRRQNGFFPYGGYGYPYWGVDSYWDMPDYSEQAPPPSSPQTPYVIVMQSPQQQAPSAPPQSPKLVEIPQDKDAPNNTAPVSAVFILSNGDRLESLRYFLTVNSLSVQQGQTERTIPLSAVNVDATIAANRERGIDLNIPRDRTQISLGF
jgi:hypothetical protein